MSLYDEFDVWVTRGFCFGSVILTSVYGMIWPSALWLTRCGWVSRSSDLHGCGLA